MTWPLGEGDDANKQMTTFSCSLSKTRPWTEEIEAMDTTTTTITTKDNCYCGKKGA